MQQISHLELSDQNRSAPLSPAPESDVLAENYSIALYELKSSHVEQLTGLDVYRTTYAIVKSWLLCGLLVFFASKIALEQWYLYPIVIFFIAGRQGALLQLVHEASHRCLSRSQRWNDFLGVWVCAAPIGVNYYGYRFHHRAHHAHTGTEKDPKSDVEKYKIADIRDPKIALLFLKDILGITALSIFFAYSDDTKVKTQTRDKFKALLPMLRMAVCQLLLLFVLFQGNAGKYILFWLIPLMSPHMFLMRVRGIAEHGLPNQLNVTLHSVRQGTFYTRSFLTGANKYRFFVFTWLEHCLIGSLNVYYHHEHHLMPNVPFYNLPKVHRVIAPIANKLNPEIYARGYFSAALRCILNRP